MFALRPNRGGAPGRVTVPFTALVPGASYTFAGQPLVADDAGTAEVSVDLDGPFAGRLEPVAAS